MVKLLNANPQELRKDVFGFLEEALDQQDVELQQRSCELMQLTKDEDLFENVLAVMPVYAEAVQQNNPLVQRLKFQHKSRAHTRAQLEQAAKSEGGMYKPGVGNKKPGEGSPMAKNSGQLALGNSPSNRRNDSESESEEDESDEDE